jgi:hypothetical protein
MNLMGTQDLSPSDHTTLTTPQPDFSQCRTQRQVDTTIVTRAIHHFADAYPLVGSKLVELLGEKGIEALTRHILDELHPRATDMYSNVARTLYDLPFGMSI